jgi:hypothetical protein
MDGAGYFKKNYRSDLAIKCCSQIPLYYDTMDTNNIELLYDYGNIHVVLSDIYYDMSYWQDSIDNLLKAKYYYEKVKSTRFVNKVNFRIAIIKIIEGKFLESIFLLEELIFKNNIYIDARYIKDSINFSLINYLCLMDFKNEYYIKTVQLRKKIDEYRIHLSNYCETSDYLFIINLLSCIENRNLDHLHYEISVFMGNNQISSELIPIYTKLFREIQKNIKS